MKKVLLISIMISISALAYAQNNDVSQYAKELDCEYPYRYNVSSYLESADEYQTQAAFQHIHLFFLNSNSLKTNQVTKLIILQFDISMIFCALLFPTIDIHIFFS